MQILTTTVARFMFAIPFGVFGLMHLGAGKEMAGMVPDYLPGTVIVYLTGVALIAVSVGKIHRRRDWLWIAYLSRPMAGS